MGRSAEEAGPHGGLKVMLHDDGTVEVEFKAFARVEWIRVTLGDLADVLDFNALAQRVEAAYTRQLSADESIHTRLVQVRLEGPCPMAEQLKGDTQREMIEEKLARYLNANEVELLAEWVTPAVDIDVYRDEPHLLGELIAVIEKLRDAPDALEGIAPSALAGFQGGDDERRHYVMNLLRDIEREAVVRLLEEDRYAH